MKSTTKTRILLVSTDRQLARNIRSALAEFPFVVLVATKPATAKAHIATRGCDAVLVDYAFAGKTCFPFVKALLKLARYEPFSMIVPNSELSKAAKFIDIGCCHHFLYENTTKLGSTFTALLRKMIRDKKKIEQLVAVQNQLSRSEAQYARAVTGSADGIWERKIDENKIHYSARWAEILGFPRKEMVKNRRWALSRIHPEDRERFDAVTSHHIKSKKPYDVEIRMRHKDGHYIWVRTRGQVFYDDNGRPSFLAGSTTDISEKKISEKALEESEARYQRAVAGSTDGIWEYRIKSDELYASPRWNEFLGYPAKATLRRGAWLRNRIHPDDFGATRLSESDFAHSDRMKDIEFRIRNKADRYVWLRSRSQVYLDENGAPEFIAGSCTEITDRKLSEEAIKESEEKYRTLFQAAADGIYLVNPDSTKFLDINEVGASRLGYEPDELIGAPLHKISMIVSKEDIKKRFNAILSGKPFSRRTVHRRKDGSDLPVELNATVVEQGGKKIILIIARDDRQRRRDEDKINDLNAELEQRVEERTVELQQSEQRFRDYADSTADRLWETDEHLIFTRLSDPNEQLNPPSDLLIGNNMLELTANWSEDECEIRQLSDAMHARKAFRDIKFYFSNVAGPPFHVSCSGQPYFKEDGSFAGFRGTTTNISDKMEAENRARGIEQKFRESMEFVGGSYCLWDSTGKFVSCNNIFRERYSGIFQVSTKGASYGQFLKTRLPFRDSTNDETELSDGDWLERRKLEFKQPFSERTIYVDGAWLLVRKVKLADDSVILFETDITGQKLSEQKFQDFAESAADRFWELDSKFDYTYISPPSRELAGAPEQMLGQNIFERLGSQRVVGDAMDSMELVFKSHQPFRDLLLTVTPPGRSSIYVTLSGKPIFDKTGRFAGYRGSTTDITARTEAEIKAQTIERKFTDAMENIGNGYALWDADGKFVSCNSAYLHRHPLAVAALSQGSTLDDFLKVSATVRTPQADEGRVSDDQWIENRRSEFRTGNSERTVDRDGQRFLHRIIRLADGSVAMFETDITEVKRGEDRMLDFAESVADRFWELDENACYTYMSHSIDDQINPARDFLGRSMYEHQKEAGGGSEEDSLRLKELLTSQKAFRDQIFFMPDREPTPAYLSFSAKPMFDESGNFKGYRGSTSDVTEKIESEIRVQNAERKFFDAMEYLGTGYCLWDADGTFLSCNEAFRKTHLGSDSVLVPGARYSEFLKHRMPHRSRIGDEGHLSDQEWFDKRLEEFQEASTENTIFIDRRWVHTRKRKLNDGSLIVFETDITLMKQAEEQVRQAQKMDSLGNLAGGVAHTLNNLLLPILALGTLELGRVEKTNPTWKSLDKIIQAGESAKREVERILAFSRQEESEKEPLDIRGVIENSLDLLRSGLPPTVDLSENLSAEVGNVLADPLQMETVLMNLVTNAAAALDGAVGKIAVTLDRVLVDHSEGSSRHQLPVGCYGRLTVTDDGPGIDPETIDRIFDPYFTTKDVGQGTGLGLSMVHGIVQQHNGSISVKSEVGIGSTFEIHLPLLDQTTPEHTKLARL